MPSVFASIPSPTISSFELGPLRIHFYALCIVAGIIAAIALTSYRLKKRGAESGLVLDVALIAVPLAIVGARIFHVVTHPDFYFGPGTNPWAVLFIWEGGIAIYGALIGGAVGVWLGCLWTGLRFWSLADALAPGLLLAQAMGRFGNWFNQELYGLPTTLPWGLEIDPRNPAFPPGLPADTLFHPTFLYEVLWNGLGVIVLLWAGKRFRLQWGKLLAVYLVWYSAGRIVWESIRIDPSEVFFGVRTNVWAAATAVALGIVLFIVQTKRHPGREPSVYRPGRERGLSAAVQSSDADFVDISTPPRGIAADTTSGTTPQ